MHLRGLWELVRARNIVPLQGILGLIAEREWLWDLEVIG
ncbi:hypothetical protein SBF1_5140002 [Candidatus Desulfosporosinus infrequens]|uniref:Uncharacterized protein n=1 Tax=Candidatus Desulfosporosinus infrequens TaxID=2043169 RepID=A0A2U3LIE1_9FIRM|nr:hypothetical protein SBF1_5140002 [Candidatus Desulfosporosinus infrequens]